MAQPTGSLEITDIAPVAAGATPANKGGDVGFRVVQNATALFAGRGVGLVFAAGANAILARYLGVEKLGEYGAIYAYLSLFAWLAALGLPSVIMREATAKREASGTVIGTGTWIGAAAGVVTLALAMALAPVAHLSGKILPLIFLGGLEIFVVPVVMIPGLMFQVEMQQWFPAAYGVARQALWLALIIVLYLQGASLVWVVGGRLAVAAVEGALNWKAGAKRARGGWKFDWEQASTLVRHGLPLSISAFAIWIYLRIDQVMLHRMVNDYALGQYVAAVRISELTETLPSAIGFAIFPVLCAAAADRQRFHAYTSTVFRILIFSSCALSLAIFLSANFIVTKYYGARFAGAAPLLQVLVWSEIAVFFSGVVTTALLARANERLMMYPAFTGAALNVFLNLWFIPRWGALGACWATLISYAISSTLVLFVAEQGRELLETGWKYLAPGILAIAAAVSVVKFTSLEYTSRAFLAAAVFCALAILFRLVVPGDFARIRSLYARLRGRPIDSGSVQEI